MANVETGELTLLNLENKRRQQPKIAHEHGAGSQCSRCGPKCAGFDLHYWRKICRNCRCGKEHHNVDGGEDPEYLVGRLLDDNSVEEKGDSNAIQPVSGPKRPLSMDVSNLATSLEQMPCDDRKRALDRQLPVHDLDPERCNAQSDQEKQRLEEYVKNVKQNAVGRGMMQECPPRYVAVAPAIGGVSKSESVTRPGIKKLPGPPPQLDRILENKMNYLSLKPLPKTPENSRKLPNFVTAKPYQSPFPATTLPADPLPVPEFPNTPPPALESLQADNGEDFLPPPPEFSLPLEASDGDNLPPPPPEAVDLPPNPPLQYDPAMEEDAAILHNELKSFMHFLEDKERSRRPIPGKLKSSAYMAAASTFNSSPKPYSSPSASASSSPLMPRFGSPSATGSPKTRRLLVTDIDSVPESKKDPAQPYSPFNNNNNTTPVNNNEPTASHPQRSRPSGAKIEIPPPVVPAPVPAPVPEMAVQVEKIWLCQNCTQPIRGGEVAIFAERAGSDKCWHPNCFSCSICHEVLAELVYFFSDDSIFCGRHYAEKMDIPRCKACDELIFSPEYTSAEGAIWHTNHFCCWICDTPLAGRQYTPIEGQPHCLDCYQKKYGKDCYECKKSIRADQTRVSHGDMHWHADAACFHCRKCRTSIVNRQFLLKNDQIFCSRECALYKAPLPQ